MKDYKKKKKTLSSVTLNKPQNKQRNEQTQNITNKYFEKIEGQRPG